MLVLRRQTAEISHDVFRNLGEYLQTGDLLVLNDTRVFPCVLTGKRENGGSIEIKLASRKSELVWDCIVESARLLETGSRLYFGDTGDLVATVLKQNDFETGYLLEFDPNPTIEQQIDQYGRLFLPIYLPQDVADPSTYQTIYARHWGSMQPPVAGMHFTEHLMTTLKDAGIGITCITMHIGRLDRLEVQKGEIEIEDHRMYPEQYLVSPTAAELINQTKRANGRVIAVGTTVMRTLESVATDDGTVIPGCGWTNLYIYPGYRFKVVDGLISNLQPPMTTNLMLACAFGGLNHVMGLYRSALQNRYRFLEFGDCAFFL